MVVGNERHRLFEEKYRSYPYRKPGLGASAAPVVGDFGTCSGDNISTDERNWRGK
jgi:hypothetical protein